MIVWMGLGIVLGALLCVGAFALDWFGVRSMVEQDIRDAYETPAADQVWDAFSRRREDHWPAIRKNDPDIDVWEAFQAPQDDGIDPWEAFGKEKGDA